VTPGGRAPALAPRIYSRSLIGRGDFRASYHARIETLALLALGVFWRP